MNTKSVLLLALVCAVLAYVGLKEPEHKKVSAALEQSEPFKALDLNNVSSVELKQGKDTLMLSKVNDEWRAQMGELNYPIDFSKLVTFLRNFQNTELLSHLANDRKLDDKFGLDEASSPALLTIKNGDKVIAKCELGKGRVASNAAPNPYGMPPEERGQFIRFGQSENVYMAKDRLDASTNASSWMKNVIAKAETDEITHIEIGTPYQQLVWDKRVDKIEKSTDGSVPPENITRWELSGDLAGQDINSSEIPNWLDDLKEVRVTEPVVSHKQSQLLPDQNYSIKVQRGENTLYELAAQKVDGDWLIWNKEKTTELYKASSYVIEQIFARNDKLLKLAKTKLDGDAMELSWENAATNLSCQKIVATWSIKGDGEQPRVKDDEIQKTLKALKEIEVLDLLPKFKGSALNTLTASANSQLIIADLGPAQLKNAHILRLGDRVATVNATTFDQLFPKAKNLLEFTKPAEKMEDLISIDTGKVKLIQKDKVWQMEDGSAVREGSVSSWVASLNSIVESPYHIEAKDFVSQSKISVKTADKEWTVDIGKADKGQVPVRLSPYNGTFAINLDVVRSLQNGADNFLAKKNANETQAEGKNEPAVVE